jgi:hypothetical protein
MVNKKSVNIFKQPHTHTLYLDRYRKKFKGARLVLGGMILVLEQYGIT